MTNNVAICIGINQYDNLPSLRFAKRDSILMRDYFSSDLNFAKTYLFADKSPPIDDADKPYASSPTYAALRRFFRVRFEEPFLSEGDNLWFFFSGHGIRHQDRDYILPADADPDPQGIDETALRIGYVTERLRRCGAGNVVLVLDACRNEGSAKGTGIGSEKLQGVVTFSSCSPAERSYEVEDLKQGAFTYAFLESMRIEGEGNCATVERLSSRLKHRVNEINQAHGLPRQTPYPVVEPASKYHLILLPEFATSTDIAILKNNAFQAEVENDLTLAKQLWLSLLVASKGSDIQAIEAIQRFPKFRRFNELERHLKNGRFRHADLETNRVMLEVVGKSLKEMLDISDIDIFPSDDLRIIDELWRKYSDERFGFGPQKQIWQNCGGIVGEFDEESFLKFATRVDWYNNGKWLPHAPLNAPLEVPDGNFPVAHIAIRFPPVHAALLSREEL